MEALTGGTQRRASCLLARTGTRETCRLDVPLISGSDCHLEYAVALMSKQVVSRDNVR